MKVNEEKLWEYWQKYIFDHCYSVFDIRVKTQFKALVEIIKKTQPGSIVIDIGSGQNVLAPLFKDAYYISLDSGAGSIGGYDYKELDILGDVLFLPVADSSIDTALLVWVLEHVCEPYIALKEVHRILKPGGVLYLLAPLFLHEHMVPYDFYRYTRHGLEYLFKKAHFEQINIKQSSGSFTSLSEISCFGIFNILNILKQSEQVIFSPEIKKNMENCLEVLKTFRNTAIDIDNLFLKNNIELLESGYPTDFICTAYKTGILSEPAKYKDKQEVLKDILACPQCHVRIFSSLLEFKETGKYKCKNCNKDFEFTGNAWKFV